MAENQTNHPPVIFYFKVLVEGVNEKDEAGFENVSGLDIKIDTETIQEGGENQFSRKLPKALQYSNLTLRRGLITGSHFMTWINKAITNFKFEPKIVNVILMNANGDPLVSWAFHNAYPVSVKVSFLNSTENKYAIESLELAYDYFERADLKTNL